MLHLICASIPITRISQITLHLMQHSMNPSRSRIIFILLDQIMRSLPVPNLRQINGLQQILNRCFLWHHQLCAAYGKLGK